MRKGSLAGISNYTITGEDDRLGKEFPDPSCWSPCSMKRLTLSMSHRHTYGQACWPSKELCTQLHSNTLEQNISTGAEFAQHGKIHCSNTVIIALQFTGTSFSLDHELQTELVTDCLRTSKTRLKEGENSSCENRKEMLMAQCLNLLRAWVSINAGKLRLVNENLEDLSLLRQSLLLPISNESQLLLINFT